MVKELLLLVNDNCGLCEQAKQSIRLAMEDVPSKLRIQSIQEDEELHQRFLLEVPVLFIDGEQALHGVIDYVDVRLALEEE